MERAPKPNLTKVVSSPNGLNLDSVTGQDFFLVELPEDTVALKT